MLPWRLSDDSKHETSRSPTAWVSILTFGKPAPTTFSKRRGKLVNIRKGRLSHLYHLRRRKSKMNKVEEISVRSLQLIVGFGDETAVYRTSNQVRVTLKLKAENIQSAFPELKNRKEYLMPHSSEVDVVAITWCRWCHMTFYFKIKVEVPSPKLNSIKESMNLSREDGMK